MKRYLFLLLVFFACQTPSENAYLVESPAGERYCTINKAGQTIIPNGRIIEPYGQTIDMAPHPFGLELSQDGSIAVTANSGTSPLCINIIKDIWQGKPQLQQIPEGYQTDKGVLESVFMGLAISLDNQEVYVAGGQANKVYVFDLQTGDKTREIDCSYRSAQQDFTHAYIGDMVLSQDGKTLYAVDQIGFRIVVIDPASGELLAHLPSGRYPFGIELSPQGDKLYVANAGMYAYQWLADFDPQNAAETALDYPAFAYGSEEARDGIHNDSVNIPGLGEQNTPEAFSVWTYALPEGRLLSQVKTGVLVGEKVEDFPAVGGASPNSLVATDQYVFVSNGNNDNISVISTETDTVVATIDLRLDERLAAYRGMIPFGMAVSPDQKRLYVAEAGINAVGVIDIPTLQLIGHIPVGWFPAKLAVSKDNQQLIVSNAKGYGSGPNGGSQFEMGPSGSYIGSLMRGSLTIMDIPSRGTLDSLTQKVISNNFKISTLDQVQIAKRKDNPIPYSPTAHASPIKHIIFVSKENRTYDEIFGQLSQGKGEAEMARYGRKASFSRRDGSLPLEAVDVMPNHLDLAERFAIADNFYVDADHSADGHRWLSGTYPNEWVEAHVPAAYGGNRSFRWDSKAPGNFALEGASGAIYPEEYNEAGSIWEHMGRNGVPFWNFGCGIMFAPHLSGSLEYPIGYGHAVNYPVPAPLFRQTSRTFPTYNLAIPDQFRIDKFIEEFEQKWLNGPDSLPPVLTVIIGNDHGAGERPEAGFPYMESYMADNDLALGRLVEFISKTPYWKNTAIVVTEDDAQGGRDHVDAHRSILMVISPYAKQNYVGHQHYSFGSIFKTFWNVLGIPYLNQFDAGATDLYDLFATQPDASPYQAIEIDSRLFDPVKAHDPLDKAFDWSALNKGPKLDDEEYLQAEAKRNE
ncbi:MAG: alkaline phosphatase family protein [Bacteroidia bacterium]